MSVRHEPADAVIKIMADLDEEFGSGFGLANPGIVQAAAVAQATGEELRDLAVDLVNDLLKGKSLGKILYIIAEEVIGPAIQRALEARDER